MFEEALDAVRIPQPRGRPRKRPKQLAGDKAYDVRRIRAWLRRHRIVDVIPRKGSSHSVSEDTSGFDREAYRRRNVVERCIGWLKECRRVGTRFEKLAVNDLGMLELAMIQLCLRRLLG